VDESGDNQLRRRVDQLEWRAGAIDEWRRGRVDTGLTRMEETVDRLTKANEIAAAVNAALSKQRVRAFTKGEKLIGLILALAGVATAVHSWVG
jgi:hypothetical protein